MSIRNPPAAKPMIIRDMLFSVSGFNIIMRGTPIAHTTPSPNRMSPNVDRPDFGLSSPPVCGLLRLILRPQLLQKAACGLTIAPQRVQLRGAGRPQLEQNV